jgi:hypothetical protein
MTTGFTVAGLLAIGGAVIVAIALPRRRTGTDSTGADSTGVGHTAVHDAAAPAAASTEDSARVPARASAS